MKKQIHSSGFDLYRDDGDLYDFSPGFSCGNAVLMSQMTASVLPSFTGDPLEWTGFRQTYELASGQDQCNYRENIIRLSEYLKGAARDATRTLLLREGARTLL